MQKMIAITGGPSGGKTTLIEILKKEFSEIVRVVPESASILYRGGFPRQQSLLGRTHAQRAIFLVQKELESWACEEDPTKIVICDRGSFDSLAYWPHSENDFFQGLGTTRAAELARYSFVLHMDSASSESFDSSNPVRIESAAEAEILNQRVRAAWAGHPERVVIPNSSHFLDKMRDAKEAIERMISA